MGESFNVAVDIDIDLYKDNVKDIYFENGSTVQVSGHINAKAFDISNAIVRVQIKKISNDAVVTSFINEETVTLIQNIETNFTSLYGG